MLILNLHTIGNKLFAIRKRSGMTQMEVAVAADLSERTYADIERGTVNMRILTFLRICQALRVKPDEILTEIEDDIPISQKDVLAKLETCSMKDRRTALRLLEVFLNKSE